MSTNYPTVSLIISTYNWPTALELCLLSVSSQKVLPSEVLIADDGSRDDTRKLIEEMQKTFPCPLIHIWHEDDGFRLSAIRNKTIAKVTSDYVIQIDGDIILEKHFIKDHLSFARKDCFVSGSRVKLKEDFSKQIQKTKDIHISLFSKGVSNHFNGLRSKTLRNYYRFRYRLDDPYYVKGCNMAFWLSDLIAVNGYNEDITGWGAEDSEIAARLMFLNKKRQFLKFGAVEYHLYHEYNSRERERINYDVILKSTKESKNPYCKNGLDKYMEE